MRSSNWEASRISSHLSDLWEWRVSYPRAPLYYIERSQGVTLSGDFFAKKPTSTDPIWNLICGADQILPYVGLYSLLAYTLLDLTWDT